MRRAENYIIITFNSTALVIILNGYFTDLHQMSLTTKA